MFFQVIKLSSCSNKFYTNTTSYSTKVHRTLKCAIPRGMAGYLICVSYESGVPIFARRIGDVAAIPFPLAASMNGVSIFGKANKVDLISTLTESGRVCWKDYKERISLIFVGSNDSLSDIHHINLLDNIYNVIVFHIGVDEIKNISNLDKLKRDCRRAYPVIDKYLYGLNPLENTLYFGDITLCADVCLQSEIQTQFQCLLEPLLENIGCGYGAIIVNGIIMAASKDWWFLKGSEICIITFVASQPSSDRFSDFPVFLPISSPKLPYRLIVSRAKKSNIQLVILCGQEPESSSIQLEIKKWKHSTKEIFNLFSKDDHPPSINSRLSTIDPSMLGFFVINNDKQRCAFSILHEGKNQTPDATSFPYRLDILRTFYRTIVGSVLSFNGISAPDQGTMSDIMRLSVAQVSPMTPGSPLNALGSQASMTGKSRIETVVDWPVIAKKYRVLMGKEEPVEPVEKVEANNEQLLKVDEY